jgi:GH25 family lysozyme M1 (1,4-beta-N-acetylmuramidase)
MLDVSVHQGDVRFGKAKADGVAAFGVKSTEGQDFVDQLFTRARIEALHRHGIPFTPYHYLRFRRGRSGAVEADHCLDVILDRGWKGGRFATRRHADMPVTVDTEWIGNEAELRAMSPGDAREYVAEFNNRVRQKTKRGTLDYLSPGFAPELGNRAPRHGRHTWVAAWDAPDGRPPTPRGFPRALVTVHQISDQHHEPYVESGVVDLNLFLGGRRALEAYVEGREIEPKPPPAPPSSPERMTVREVQRALRRIGWPLKVDGVRGPATVGAVMDFQRGYVGGGRAVARLTRDGVVGPKTAMAIAWSLANDGRVSPHFRWVEFRSKETSCNGNRWIKTHRALVAGLERYREMVGHPVEIVSGYRDPAKNRCEGGASQSQHMFANGADLVPEVGVDRVRALRAFSGIGFQGASGLVRHVDVRAVGPNFTGGSVAAPTVWRYG